MQQQSRDDQRNLFLAIGLSFLVIMVWQIFFGPQPPTEEELAAQQAVEQAAQAIQGDAQSADLGGALNAAPLNRDAALAQSDRIRVETPKLSGSIAMKGGRIDELLLTGYREELPQSSPNVELLWPFGTENAYYAVFGWRAQGGVAPPREQAPWILAPGSPSILRPGEPVTLLWDNGAGLRFSRKIAVDDRYLFTITQTVENMSNTTVRLQPLGKIERHGHPALTAGWLLHEGPIGVIDGSLQMLDYDDLEDAQGERQFNNTTIKRTVNQVQETGWLGFTDKYWMTALSPASAGGFDWVYETFTNARGQQVYRAYAEQSWQEISPGATGEAVTHLFLGAKEISAIRDYQYLFDGDEQPRDVLSRISDFLFKSSESRFIDSIDWGWFFFLTKPLFEVLLAINSLVGNMGVAIILLTLLVKTLLFPLAYKSFVSMSKLKLLQPEMQKIKERVGEDRMKMQQEMMALYKKEKVNPAAGCMPILLQIPIFFSLYKVLFVTLEIRHAPFFGWIQDLSAPDPTSIWNLFGLLPYDMPAWLPNEMMLSVWALLMGLTMWLQQMLNPAPTDPMQEKIFNLLPLIFMFLLGGFASGLVIYWVANNTLTFMQQYTIMRSQGVKPNILGNIKKQLGLAPRHEPSSG